MEAVEQGRVAVEGGQVAYRVFGTGSRALLCLHGGPGVPSPSLESLADLASDDLRVVLYDQLGCGESEAPDDPSLWTMDRFVREVEQVRSALDLAVSTCSATASAGCSRSSGRSTIRTTCGR